MPRRILYRINFYLSVLLSDYILYVIQNTVSYSRYDVCLIFFVLKKPVSCISHESSSFLFLAKENITCRILINFFLLLERAKCLGKNGTGCMENVPETKSTISGLETADSLENTKENLSILLLFIPIESKRYSDISYFECVMHLNGGKKSLEIYCISKTCFWYSLLFRD